MQVVEATSFLLLSIWWAVSATLFHITRGNIAAGDGMLAASGNSTVPEPNLAQDATAAYGMSVSTGLQFALLGSSVCYICSTQVHAHTHTHTHTHTQSKLNTLTGTPSDLPETCVHLTRDTVSLMTCRHHVSLAVVPGSSMSCVLILVRENSGRRMRSCKAK